jgi:hypothetical protein
MADKAVRLPEAIDAERFGGSPVLRVIALAALPLAIAIGAAVAVDPLLGVLSGAALFVAIVFMLGGHRLTTMFLATAACLLVLYAFLGRGIAHLGAPPVYIGEIGLALAVPAIIVSLRRVRIGLVEMLIVLFMGWGLVRTVPFLPVHGIDALRDGVLWGYALFALAIAWTVRPEHFRLMIRLYRRLIPLLLLWTPIAAIIGLTFRSSIPGLPGSDVPALYFKPGDFGVHLAGIAAFILAGLYEAVAPTGPIRQAVIWLLWLLGAGIAGAVSRGSLLASSMALLALPFARTSSRWFVPLFVGVLVISIAIVANPSLPVPGRSRDFSVQQLAANVVSVVADTDEAGLAGTKNWRLEWWDEITRYTIHGRYFLEGKGYGINLADDDDFQVLSDGSLRSPHSSHFEILARSGVVGLTLWILIQLAFAATLLRAARRARLVGRPVWVAVAGWLFVYWAAALVNSSFDVYFQGPQGGIWFWVIIGLGIGVTKSCSEPLHVANPPATGSDRSGTRVLSVPPAI